MTILFLSTRAFAYCRGGIERFSLELGKRFVEDGHSVLYLSFTNDLCESESGPLGFNTKQLYLPDVKKIDSRENLDYVRQLVSTEKIDILFNQQADTSNWIDLCASVKQGVSVKVVTILHFDPYHYFNIFEASNKSIAHSGLNIFEKFGLFVRNTSIYKHRQQKLFGKVFTSAINKSDAFVIISQNAYSRLQKMLGDVDENKINVISNPLTVESVDTGKSYKRNQLLFVGRMTMIAKRPDLLLQIWERLYNDFPDWQLIVLGDGEYLPVAKKKVQERGLKNVVFKGMVSSSEFYKSASILCVTSNSEGFSLVTVEASHNYVVPVAFDSFTAVNDVIQNESTGYIVPAFDIDEYVARLRLLMSDPELRSCMAESAHVYVKRFSMDNIAPRWYNLFSSLTTNP